MKGLYFFIGVAVLFVSGVDAAFATCPPGTKCIEPAQAPCSPDTACAEPALTAQSGSAPSFAGGSFDLAQGQPLRHMTQEAPSPREYWLRNYSLSPYSEYWRATLTVKDLEGDLPKVLDLLKSMGATLTEPLSNFASSRREKVQQLSYRVSKKSLEQSLQKIGSIGSFSPPVKRPNEDLKLLPEIKAHIRKLAKEKKNHPKALAAMPNVSAVVDELLRQLKIVEAVYEKAGDDVLLNLTVQESR